MKKITLIISFVIALSINAMATTWAPAKHICPICKSKNTFQEIMSYGGYIYNWPSKYQYVYWPLTDNPSVYCCLDCYFSCYMGDFDSIPENMIDTVKAYLTTINHPKKYKDYLNIPITTRLEIAENIYSILGQDAEFWCRFYRVFGYHYSAEKENNKAFQSRIKALNLAKQMICDTIYIGREKENLFIVAAMYNYTDQKDSALIYLDKASTLIYTNSKMEEDNAKGLDDYLTNLIIEYKVLIKSGDKIEE